MLLFRRIHLKISGVLSANFPSPYSDQAEARRMKNKAAKQRREERLEQKRKDLIQQFAKEEEAAK